MTFNPFSQLTAKIYGGVALLAVGGLAVQTVRIEGFLWIDGFKDEILDLNDKIDDLEDAAEKNRQDQAQVNQQTQDRSRAAATETTYETKDDRTRSDNAADWKRNNRVRHDQVRRSPGAAAEGDLPAAGSDRPGEDPVGDEGYVAVPAADYDILIENTNRLIRVNRWSEKMIENGDALPLPLDAEGRVIWPEPDMPVDRAPVGAN